MKGTLGMFLFCAALQSFAAAPEERGAQLEFTGAALDSGEVLSQSMVRLAQVVIPIYTEAGDNGYLDNLFRLQIVAGKYDAAIRTLSELRSLRPSDDPRKRSTDLQYELFALARQRERDEGIPFDRAFEQAYRDAAAQLDDRSSAFLAGELTLVNEPALHRDLGAELSRVGNAHALPLAEALKLIHAYQVHEAYLSFLKLTPTLIAEDDRRRYRIESDVLVRTPHDGQVCTRIMRPLAGPARLPTLLNFTIYADPARIQDDARRTASNGYAAVVGLTRGKGCSPNSPVPYEFDGADAAALIDWIARQPWSDGRVGMYGGSYEGFTQWAAAKHMPKALKALMPGAPVGPGIDVPMEGNVFFTFVYPWPFYTMNTKFLDEEIYLDSARWDRLNRNWYSSGRAYRDLEQIDGTPNPIFDRWISHPSYDAYWQGMIPYREEFARINIPVLTTAGYFAGGPGAAVSYFSEHYKYRPDAEHYLLIGPYDHLRGHRGTIDLFGDPITLINGYKLDPVAQIDMGELRYQWFDYVFRGAPRPAILQDRVNYQVTGTNTWKHAPTLAAMANHESKWFLSAKRVDDVYRLSDRPPITDSSIQQTVDLSDRSDVDRPAVGGNAWDQAVDTANALEFVSAPFSKATELSGLFSGELDFAINKRDFDFNITLYEKTTSGNYFELSQYWSRASYARDHRRRRLLLPGAPYQLAFRSVRLMSHLVQPGSRLVVVLSVIKDSGAQINYGTGRDVSDESIADAGSALHITWRTRSYIKIPFALDAGDASSPKLDRESH
jgi:putative CocE/NonD family hydrolase